MRRLAILSAVLLTVAGAACRPGQPLVDTEPGKNRTPGTIAGAVRTTANDPLPGRTVHAVNTETGKTYSAVTGVTGGFSIKIPPGKYRLELDLREREEVAQQPGIIDINQSDLDTDLDIVIR
jgi:carboxypeptidase family protein